jgi:hypothetical protein
MAQVKVSLNEPWVGSTDGSVRLNLGWEAAVVPDGAGVYANGNKPVPGKRIFVQLYPQEGKNVALIPEEIAKLYFGDWTAIAAEDDNGPQYRIIRGPIGNMREKIPTKSQIKDDVAFVWGDYRRDTERGHKQGTENFPTGTNIGPPPMPHVTIESIGSDGSPDGKMTYDPWEFLGYNEEFAEFQEGVGGVKVILDYGKAR